MRGPYHIAPGQWQHRRPRPGWRESLDGARLASTVHAQWTTTVISEISTAGSARQWGAYPGAEITMPSAPWPKGGER